MTRKKPTPFSRNNDSVFIIATISMPKCLCKSCTAKYACKSEKSKCRINYLMVKRMLPAVIIVAVLEVFVGMLLLSFTLTYDRVLDRQFGTEKTVSTLSVIASVALIVTGAGLLLIINFDSKIGLYCYIVTATILCVFLFIVSLVLLDYGLTQFEKDLGHYRNFHSFLERKSFRIAMSTIVGTVIHFLGNAIVFTYYNFKYTHPIMFSCGHVPLNLNFDQLTGCSKFYKFTRAHIVKRRRRLLSYRKL